jgi:hypothetical protein
MGNNKQFNPEVCDMVNAIWGFLGTVIGGLIAMATQYLVAKRLEMTQLRLAAIEKRLSTHQDAFEQCHKLRLSMHSPNEQDRKRVCEEWESIRGHLTNLSRDLSMVSPVRT